MAERPKSAYLAELVNEAEAFPLGLSQVLFTENDITYFILFIDSPIPILL